MLGFDNLPINHHLVLSITMPEAIGGFAYDRARPHHSMVLNGPPAWAQIASGLTVLDFNPATPDFLDCPIADTADLDFTTEDFSLAAWICIDSLVTNRMVMCRGFLSADGWHWAVLMDGSFCLYTNQAAAFQFTQSALGIIAINTWYLIGASRDGASVRLYRNGIDVTDVIGIHIDPLTSARELHIGIYDTELVTGSPWDGRMWNPRIWSGRALTQKDHKWIFEYERHWLGV